MDFSTPKAASGNLDAPWRDRRHARTKLDERHETRPGFESYRYSTLLFSWVMNNAWFVNYKGLPGKGTPPSGMYSARTRVRQQRGKEIRNRTKPAAYSHSGTGGGRKASFLIHPEQAPRSSFLHSNPPETATSTGYPACLIPQKKKPTSG